MTRKRAESEREGIVPALERASDFPQKACSAQLQIFCMGRFHQETSQIWTF
jgi:hypothetical protein